MCEDSFGNHPQARAVEVSDHSVPVSPNSLSTSELPVEHQTNALASHQTEESVANPSSLHLLPVTWESISGIKFPEGEHFDIVDGILVWVPMAHGTTKHQQVLTSFVLLIVQLRQWYATAGVDLEVASINSSSRKLLKYGDSDVNRRGPDVVVLRDHGAFSESSSDSKDTPQIEKCVFRTKERPPYAVMEVTSESTRTVDVTTKWIQYALTEIQFYYIVDLNYYESSGEACVIVGSRDPLENAVQCYHGSPQAPPSSWQAPNLQKEELYYKKVYRGDELVNVGIFKDVPLTASKCMDPAHLKHMFRFLKHGGDSAHKPNSKRTSSGSSAAVPVEATTSRGANSFRALKKQEKQTESVKKRSSTISSKDDKRSHTTSTSKIPSRSPPTSPEKKRSKRGSNVV